MKIVKMVQTLDGELHETEADAHRHLKNLALAQADKIAAHLRNTEHLPSAIIGSLDLMRQLVYIKDDMTMFVEPEGA